MSNQTALTRKEGTIASSVSSKFTWGFSQERARREMVITVTATADCTLSWQEAATEAELASPKHTFTESLTANVTKRIFVGQDPSLPFGQAWVHTGTGNYTMDGGRRG